MWPGHQNNIGDQNIISVPQRPYNVTLPPPLLRTYTGLQILTGPWQNPLFFSFSLIYRYIRLIYIWNIFFQNLQNLSFQKSIYVLGLSLTVKKLFKFEVMFRKGVPLFLFTSKYSRISSEKRMTLPDIFHKYHLNRIITLEDIRKWISNIFFWTSQ